MLCEKCGKKPAVMKFNQIIHNEKHTCCICEDCAMEMMGSHLSFGSFDPFAAFSGFFQNSVAEHRPYDTVCPGCGTTFRRFLDTGKFGCARCYETFEDRLGAVFRKIHNASEHSGKVPEDAHLHLKRTSSPTEELTAALKEAVASEDYERAAVLKKQLDAMERGDEQ